MPVRTLKHVIDTKTKLALLCGAVAGILFPSVFLIEGAARDKYDPLIYPISSLAIGNYGWIQDTNFIICGLLVFIFAIGLKRRLSHLPGHNWLQLFIILVGVGLTGAGIFSTDPVYGYPIGKPYKASQFTTHGHLHTIFSLLVFICLPIACFILWRQFIRRKKPRWAIYSLLSGVFMLATFIISGMAFGQLTVLGSVAGLLQRMSVTTGWVWMFMVALHLLNRRNSRNHLRV